MTSPWLKATVFLWWLLSLTENLQNSDLLTEPLRTANWAIARKYLRFVELTMFQFLIGGVATAVWLKVVDKKPFHPKDLNSKSVTLVTILNVVGNLGMNFADSTHTERTREEVWSWEPVIMFTLLVSFGYQRTYRLSSSVFVAVTAMAVGSWLFLRSWRDDGFNFCGIIAALASGIAFSLRNIVLKGFGETWRSPLHKYCVMSVYGFLVLAPLALAKLLLTRILPLVQPDVLLKSTAFNCVRGFTSILVLETIFPMLHAVLAIAVRFSVSMVTVTTVTAHERLPWTVLAGSSAFAAGLSFYFGKSPRGSDGLRRTIVYFVLVLHFLFSSRFLFLKFTLRSNSDAEPKTFASRRLVRTFWTYNESPSDEVLLNIETMHAQIPSARIHVECGTFLCMEKIRGIRNPEITTSFLKFHEILHGSPLERWFSRHPLHKVLSGRHFEDHVHEAVRLALLWHHGGATVDPFLRIHEAPVREFAYTSPWVPLVSDNETGGILRACNFSRRHPFVTMLARLFVDHHSDAIDSNDGLKNFVLDFHNTTSRALLRFCLKSPKHCPRILGIKSSVLKNRKGKREFVVVSGKSNTDLNLAIENLANVQFLPFVDEILRNDRYKTKINESSTTGFVGSVWTGNRIAWTFLRNMNYVLLSARVDYRNRPSSEDIENLRHRAPVGCFDSETVKILRNNGIKAFYLGGISLLAENSYSSQIPRNGVYLIDVDEEVKKRLPLAILRNAISVDLAKWDHLQPNRRGLFKMAYGIIEKYSTAKLIITQNVRCALASAAVNTPVIYINSTDIPGEGSEVENPSLLNEVPEVFHIVEPGRLFEDVLRLTTDSNSSEVFTNRNASLLARLRATAWSAIRKHASLRDSALRFGVVPFPRAPRAAPSNTTTVHLIFTTSARTSIVLGGVESRVVVEGTFMWRHWRCIEAVFHHHPFATVVIHSNTLSQVTFDVLTEAGYDIRVESYDLVELARGTPAEAFAREELPYAREGEHWYSHETDLLRLLILFRRGGVYMDTDIIVVRSLSDLPTNVVGWESSLNMNGAFLKFRKGHPFLEACIRKFSRHYSQAWSENGPLLISRVWREWSRDDGGGGDVSAVHRNAFYMFSYREIKKECFEETSGSSYKTNLKILRNVAYVVHLYSKVTAAYGTKERKIKEGTLCKHILNSFCVLCDEVY